MAAVNLKINLLNCFKPIQNGAGLFWIGFFFYFSPNHSRFSGMRPKIIITVLLAGLAGLAVIFFLKPPANQPQTAAVPIVQPAASAPETKPAIPQVSPTADSAGGVAPIKPANPVPVATAEVTGEGAEFIQEQINRLEELETKDDDASLKAILAELTNTNRIIRHVAIEATIQFGGHTAVPVLQGLAARTWDPAEKQELLDAAEFLALPTLTEVRAENPDVKIIAPQDSSPAPEQP